MTETFTLPYEKAYQGSSQWNTLVDDYFSGSEQRRDCWTASRKSWTLEFKKNNANFQELLAFFDARKGKKEAFYWTWAKDWSNPYNVATAIKALLASSSNLQALWLFDTVSGTTVLDYSGNGINLTLSADASTLSPSKVAEMNYLNFDGSTFESSDADDLSFGDGSSDNPFSIIALINPNSVNGNQILTKSDLTTGSEKREWAFYFEASSYKLMTLFYDNSSGGYLQRYYSPALTSDIGTWHSYAMTYNGNSTYSGINLYRDGTTLTCVGIVSGAYTAMENLTAKAGNYRISTTGVKQYIGNSKYGFIAVIAEELTQPQIAGINAILNARSTSYLTNKHTGGDGKQYLVRFDTDKLDYNMQHMGYASLQIPIIEVKS